MILSLSGDTTILIQVSVADAELICNLRNEESVSRYLSSSIAISAQEQINWMKENALRKDNFYFKIVDKLSTTFSGTISLYNIKDNLAEFGRYICINPLQAIEAEYLILQFAFNVLFLDKVYCRTAEDNKSVWNQHYKYGFIDAGTEIFEGKNMNLKVQEIDKNTFETFDYSFVSKLTNRFTR